MNRETVDHYFSLLHDTLSRYNLLGKVAQIYNMMKVVNPHPLKLSPQRVEG